MLAVLIVIAIALGMGFYLLGQNPVVQENLGKIAFPGTQDGGTGQGFKPVENAQENPVENQEGTGVDNGSGSGAGDAGGAGNQTGNNDGGNGDSGNGGENGGDGEEGNGGPDVPGSCIESEGRICEEGQECDGAVLSTTDTLECCFGDCIG